MFEEEFFEQLTYQSQTSKQIERLFQNWKVSTGSLREALFNATGELDGFDENDDFDEDNFDESSIVNLRVASIRDESDEDLYGDPSLYDRVEFRRVHSSFTIFPLKSEGLSVDTNALGINTENAKGEQKRSIADPSLPQFASNVSRITSRRKARKIRSIACTWARLAPMVLRSSA